MGEKWGKVILWVVISTTIIAIAMVPTVTCAKQCSFPAIFNFGDSNSDTGAISAAFGQAPPPNGITFFHTPAGRFSDGRLIIDFIGNLNQAVAIRKLIVLYLLWISICMSVFFCS